MFFDSFPFEFFILCMNVLSVCISMSPLSGASRSKKRLLDALELELQTILSAMWVLGTQLFCKSSQCSYLLSNSSCFISCPFGLSWAQPCHSLNCSDLYRFTETAAVGTSLLFISLSLSLKLWMLWSKNSYLKR